MELDHKFDTSRPEKSKALSKKQHTVRQKLKTNKSNVLYFEVVSSKTSVVNLED